MKKTMDQTRTNTAVAPSLKDAYQKLLKETVRPIFEEMGFKAASTNKQYKRVINGIEQHFAANAYGNRANDPLYAFTFEIFLINPATKCSYANRYGLLSHGGDHWYWMDTGNIAALTEQVDFDIRHTAVPLFTQCQSAAALEKLTTLNGVKPYRSLPPALRKLFPGTGRDFEAEYRQLMQTTVFPFFEGAGFEWHNNLLRTIAGPDLIQYVQFDVWTDEERSFLDIEGMITFVKSTEQTRSQFGPVPPEAVVGNISLAYIVTGQSNLYNRYCLRDHTPRQMAALMRDDLTQKVQPFLEVYRTMESIDALKAEINRRKNKQGQTDE